MPIGPYSQDVLTRILNVNWSGGAVFIAVGDSEMILRAEIKKSDIQGWHDQPSENRKSLFNVISIPDDFSGESQYAGARGGSYRKVGDEGTPMFVLAGFDQAVVHDTLASHTWGTIMYSHDGKEWTLAGKLETGGFEANDAGFQAVVWDDGFYAYAFSNEYYFSEPPEVRFQVKAYQVLFSSTDGIEFSEADRSLQYDSAELEGESAPPFERPLAFEEHFNNPADLPDGTFGYYETWDSEGNITESFLAVPRAPSHYWLNYTNLETDASNFVDITIFKDRATTKKTVATPIYVNGIAYVDEILMVGGRIGSAAAIACSIDQGDTWETVWEADADYMQEVWVILGAPMNDFK